VPVTTAEGGAGRRERLDDAEIARRLEQSEWKQDAGGIERTFRFSGFRDAIGFVDRVADLAEQRDHHPDIDIRWNRVRLRLSTHSAGGVTPMDFELAEAIDGVAEGR
jgi:4a-hydroxytetrahydrobiopterin dehydratase